MKDTYDFSKGKRGRIVPEPPLEPGKVRITIRLDEDLVDYFGAIADRSGGSVGYQTLYISECWCQRRYFPRKPGVGH